MASSFACSMATSSRRIRRGTSRAGRDRSARRRASRSAASIPRSAIAQSATDPDMRLAAERDAAAYLELAYAWGAPLIRVFGGEPQGGKSADDVAAPMADLLERIGQRAEQVGVGVALETHDFFSASTDVMRILTGAEPAMWRPVGHAPPLPDGRDRRGDLRACRLPPDARPCQGRGAGRERADRLETRPPWEGEVPVAETVKVPQRHRLRQMGRREWEKKWHPEIEPPEIALPHDGTLLREWLEG